MASLSDLSVGEFGDDVEVPEVAGVLLNEMEQDAFQRRWIVTVPAETGFADLGEIVRLDNRSAAPGLRVKRGAEVLERLLGCDVPTVAAVVAPRIGDRKAFEAPFDSVAAHSRGVPRPCS